MVRPFVSRIVSGGQTGVDRAALDFALDSDIPCGGWCPKGRKAADGILDEKYPLLEANSDEYPVRTELNVVDSDGTLIITRVLVTGGTALTVEYAKTHSKPYLIVDLLTSNDTDPVRSWIHDYRIRVINIAGPKESKVPGIYNASYKFLRELFTPSYGRSGQPRHGS